VSNIYLTPCCRHEVQKSTQELKSVKGPGNTFDINTKWERTLPSLTYLLWDIYRDLPSIKKIKYQSWYLTPCCGLEVQKPTQALKSALFSFSHKLFWIFSQHFSPAFLRFHHRVSMGFQSKVFPGPLTDLSACVDFCTSSPQQDVKYQLWYLIFFLWRTKRK
jgi:hypothetical protein